MAGTRLRARPGVVLLAAAAIVVASAGGAIAGHQAANVKSYTGCLTNKGGTLTLIAEGNSPQKPCPAGSVQAHFSGGDITAITVGTGLTGGGTNGHVNIGLDPQYSLRQDCATSQVLKWNSTTWACANDNDTTYAAGTGLDLTGTTFSVEPDAFAKTDQSCSSGQFANGVDGDGDLTCAASAAASLTHAQATQTAEQGIPDDGADHTFLSVNPAAGTYLVVAKGVIGSALNVDDFSATRCNLKVGGTSVDEISLGSVVTDELTEIPFALTGIGAAGAPITLTCSADNGADGMSLDDAKLVAVRIGS